MSNYLDISKISIDFPTPEGPFRALDELSLRIKKGEFVSLIGHSGCGKSTVLNILAGLLQATEGGVALDGKEVNEPGPDRAVVFQNHSLLPWLTAFENVELAVKQVFKKTKSRAEIRDWVEHNLELVHMGHALHKKPDEISGGMKQRVGIARALAMQPQVLLMDEPFGSVDAQTRRTLQEDLLRFHQNAQKTVIFVTHSMEEAEAFCDRVGIIKDGLLLALDTVDNLRAQHNFEYKINYLPDGSSGNGVTLYGSDDQELVAKVRGLGHNQFSVGKTTLEDVYLSLTKDGEGFDDGTR